jgi:hypothetical protein
MGIKASTMTYCFDNDDKDFILPNGQRVIVDPDGQVYIVDPTMAKPVIKDDSKSGPNYDEGRWYRFTFYIDDISDSYVGEEVYTTDIDYITEEVRNLMISRGYTHYFCNPRACGKWIIGEHVDDAIPL